MLATKLRLDIVTHDANRRRWWGFGHVSWRVFDVFVKVFPVFLILWKWFYHLLGVSVLLSVTLLLLLISMLLMMLLPLLLLLVVVGMLLLVLWPSIVTRSPAFSVPLVALNTSHSIAPKSAESYNGLHRHLLYCLQLFKFSIFLFHFFSYSKEGQDKKNLWWVYYGGKTNSERGGENGPIVTKNEAQLCSLFSSLDRSENYNCVQDRMELLFLPWPSKPTTSCAVIISSHSHHDFFTNEGANRIRQNVSVFEDTNNNKNNENENDKYSTREEEPFLIWSAWQKIETLFLLFQRSRCCQSCWFRFFCPNFLPMEQEQKKINWKQLDVDVD